MQLTLHATRRTPHGASRLVQAMPAWSVKPRRAPSRHSRDARVYGHMTTAMHEYRVHPSPSGVLFLPSRPLLPWRSYLYDVCQQHESSTTSEEQVVALVMEKGDSPPPPHLAGFSALLPAPVSPSRSYRYGAAGVDVGQTTLSPGGLRWRLRQVGGESPRSDRASPLSPTRIAVRGITNNMLKQ